MCRTFTALLSALTLTCAAAAVHAHGDPLPLSAWGDFGAGTAHCQRALGQAVARCADEIFAAHRACIEPQLRGEPCNLNARSLAIRTARARVLERIEAACTDTDATRLQFLGVHEALADATSTCRQLEKELFTAVYGPALVGDFDEPPVVAEVTPDTAACLHAAADRAVDLLRVTTREQRSALDRIAAHALPLDGKTAVIDRFHARAAGASAHAARRTAAGCAAATFTAIYGRSIDTFAADLAARAECLAAGVYVQDALVCPAAVCGNGMEELGEDCDDGNTDDTDACRNDCTRGDCLVHAGTFAAIEDLLFEQRGCAVDACHGDSAAGELDLRLGDAYDQLVGVPSPATGQPRVAPGDPEASRLWQLLARATLGRDDLPGPPMPPPGEGDPLSADELEAVRLWIAGGAPRTGAIAGTGPLLGVCLPPPAAERK